MKARVFLATTAGPVRIERLTRERAQQSAVCLGRSTRVLAVSADYDAFVRQPSGVIEREFPQSEPGAYRLDVSAPIDDGDSWQLGVFAAHMLAENGLLAGPDEPADKAVWLTGAVHNDLAVAPVDHIAEKLRASREAFAAIIEEGLSLTLVLPPGGADLAREANLSPEVIVAEAISTAKLGAILNADVPKPLTADPSPDHESLPPHRRWGRFVLLLAAVIVAIATMVAAVSSVMTWRELQKWRAAAGEGITPGLADALDSADASPWPPSRAAAWLFRRELADVRLGNDDYGFGVLERVAPDGSTCAAVHFGNVAPETREVPKAGADTAGNPDRLCGLVFRFTVSGDPLYVAATDETLSGNFISVAPLPPVLEGGQLVVGDVDWVNDLPRRMAEPTVYRINFAVSRYPIFDGWRGLDSESRARLTALGVIFATAHITSNPEPVIFFAPRDN